MTWKEEIVCVFPGMQNDVCKIYSLNICKYMIIYIYIYIIQSHYMHTLFPGLFCYSILLCFTIEGMLQRSHVITP